ncbi:transcription initiation factor IIB [Natrinema amylolyticum]|uniref:transcription initiation factor IIB n=1 Tax=Natrinema amylolyticum TaxID=2878679 RepID=UPI001CFAE56D|nr:transcription initiation factor IIB family protein [Natrinema amylolyticum]
MTIADSDSGRFDRETSTERTTLCPECSGSLITITHETQCRECGLIVEEDLLDYGPDWFTSTDGTSQRRTGAPLTAGRHDRGLSTEIGWRTDARGNPIPGRKRRQLSRLRRQHRRSQWRSKRERNLADGLGEVRRLASVLELSTSLRDQACTLFRRAQDRNLCSGRSLEGIAAASVYVVCRCNRLGRTRDEIAAGAQCSRAQLECAYTAINTELDLPIPTSRPQDILPRLATELDVPCEVRYRALELADLAEEAGFTIGRHPHGFAAACLYSATQETGYRLTQQAIADVAGTSTTTLRSHRNGFVETFAEKHDD